MKTRTHSSLAVKASIVILLTLSVSCASILHELDPQSEDPIARVALAQTEEASKEKEILARKQSPQNKDGILWATEWGELLVGMETQDVLSAWGRPTEIETAGDSRSGNQRWIYTQNGKTYSDLK